MNKTFVMTCKEFYIKAIVIYLMFSFAEKLIVRLYEKMRNKSRKTCEYSQIFAKCKYKIT